MFIQSLSQFASEAAHAAEESTSDGGILGVLGVDVRLLVLQTIAFLILVWALAKWVYPVLVKAIDDRQAAMDAGVKASQEAQKQAEEAEAKIGKELKEARKQADDILAATHKEASAIIAEAEEKAARRAKSIVEEAKADMDNQVQAAREALKGETRKLVAQATEQIIAEKVDLSKDAKLVDAALQRAQGKA
jgi:F-type H+-transporting ATPase subunit b